MQQRNARNCRQLPVEASVAIVTAKLGMAFGNDAEFWAIVFMVSVPASHTRCPAAGGLGTWV